MAVTLFWICFGLVVYTFVGYVALLRALLALKRLFVGRPAPARRPDSDAEWPEVTLLICAYNEEAEVERKMQNCRQLQYAAGRLHVVWCTDGSDDHTVELLSAYDDVTVLHEPERRGKTAALNRAMQHISTPLVVFTDANTQLNPEAIEEIVAAFQDPKVGCVSGEKRIAVRTSDGVAAGGEGAYWKYESTLKRWDSELYSTMGAAGELFAIRRELFEPMDLNMLLDDFIMSMLIVKRGYRIAYVPTAYALETGSADLTEEQKRKRRIAAGGLQSIWRLRSLMNPLCYPTVAFQFVSHRVLRWSITPFALLALVPLNVWLVMDHAGSIYTAIWVLQCVFYMLATIGFTQAAQGKKSKLTYIPMYFLFMNLNVFAGIRYLLRKRKGTGAWEKARRAAAVTSSC